jgi:hypothetical protein
MRILAPNQMRGTAFVVLTDIRQHFFRRQRNEIDSGDQTGIDIVRIFWFAARNAQSEFPIRRDVTNFFKRRGSLSVNRLRRNKQQTHKAP